MYHVYVHLRIWIKFYYKVHYGRCADGKYVENVARAIVRTTGIPNQQVWQSKWKSRFLARKRVATRTFREKKQQLSRVFFSVYTEKEKDLEGEKKRRRRILLEKQHEHFISAVRKWEMPAVSKEKPAR